MSSAINRVVSVLSIGVVTFGAPSFTNAAAQEAAQEEVVVDETSAAVEALVEAIQSALSEIPEDASTEQTQIAVEEVLEASGESEEVQEAALFIILADAEADGETVLADAVEAILTERFAYGEDDATGGTGGVVDGGSSAIAAPESGISGGGSDY